MKFENLEFDRYPADVMLERSSSYLNALKNRRSIREFSIEMVSEELIMTDKLNI